MVKGVQYLKGSSSGAHPFQLLQKVHSCSVVGQEQGRHTSREGTCMQEKKTGGCLEFHSHWWAFWWQLWRHYQDDVMTGFSW